MSPPASEQAEPTVRNASNNASRCAAVAARTAQRAVPTIGLGTELVWRARFILSGNFEINGLRSGGRRAGKGRPFRRPSPAKIMDQNAIGIKGDIPVQF